MNTHEFDRLLEFLSPYPIEVQELALAARAAALPMFEHVSEIFWDATQAVCLGFTFTHSTKENFFNFAVYANHVTWIFPWGIKLVDTEKRLKGEGNQVRNLRLLSIEMLNDPYVLDLIKQAEAIAVKPAEPLLSIQIVRVMNGPKRRPNPNGNKES